MIQTYFGLCPKETSLIGYKGAAGYASWSFHLGWDLGINWKTEGPEYSLLTYYGGIVAGASYAGWYNFEGARSDMENAVDHAEHYGIDYSEQLRIWVRAHRIMEEFYDLLELAAEKLFHDKVLDSYFWEENILLVKQVPILGI